MTLDDLLNQASNLLLKYGKSEIGFFAQEIGVGPGVSATTANCIMALAKTGKISSSEIDTLIEELLSLQYAADNKYAYSFCKEEVSSTWATSKALICIFSLKPGMIASRRVQKAVEWLINNRNPDRGWGYRKGNPSRSYYTYFALNALSLAVKQASPEQQTIYTDCIETARQFLIASRNKEGVWSNGTNTRPCPINTLMALAALKLTDNLMGKNIVTPEFLSKGRELITIDFEREQNWVSYSWSEPGIAFKTISPFPPGKIPQLLVLFSPWESVVLRMIDWLEKNFQKYETGGGWVYPIESSTKPYTWVTALAIRSIVDFMAERQAKVERSVRTEPTISVRKRQLKTITLLLGAAVSMAYVYIIGGFISPTFGKLVVTPFDFSALPDIVGGLFLLFIPLGVMWSLLRLFIKYGRISYSDIKRELSKVLSRI